VARNQPPEPRGWLADTKFHPPLLREDVISRGRLLGLLHDALSSHPLILLSAPAGYGKTTLLASLRQGDHLSLPLAWLSLDEEDNDLARFLSAFVIALQRLIPGSGVIARTLLVGHATPGAESWRVMSVLINEVLDTLPVPFGLILDDLHRVSQPAIFAALDYLLEHIPPQMHLVVGTRLDPPLALARLRARGQVAELRASDLRFTVDEAMSFLNVRLGLDLSPDEVGLLQSRTEGWAVGLRLLAGSLHRLPDTVDRAAFVEHLVHTDRYVFDFLAEEVLNRQEPEVRTFLLETAILPELTAALCQAVTGRADAGTLLEDLYRRNLFLVTISDRRSSAAAGPSRVSGQLSYRYHDLFAEFLRYKLQEEWPARVLDLHHRAGQAELAPVRAVGHYLAAGRWQEAAEIIEQVGAEMITRGYLDSLSRWINALHASVRDRQPRLLHYLSSCAFWKGAWPEVQSLLERALQAFQAAGDEAGQGEVLADLAICAAFQADLKKSYALFDQALAHTIPPHIRVLSLLGRALPMFAWGDWSLAERDFRAAMAVLQQAGELDLLHLLTFPVFDPGLAFLPGGLEQLDRVYQQARSQVGDEISRVRLIVEKMAMVLHLLRGQLVEAVRDGERALALRERLGGHPFAGIDSALFLIMAHAARADYSAAEPLFDLLFLGVSQTDPPSPDLAINLLRAGRVRWLQGRLNEAREIYAQMCAVEDSQREVPAARICRAWMWSLLEIAEGRHREAERALRRPEVLEQKDRCSTTIGSTRLMLARLY